MKSQNIKVAVGMSGGVDSSVAAALLKKQGYDVFGVFFHFWGEKINGQARENICCSLESQEDARRVANKLGIKFYTINLEPTFKEKVVEDFIAEYQAGKTPNPCVRCNQFIKFGEALTKVRALGADYLATGHYCQIKKSGDKFFLLKGKDKEKDQTYFLYRLNQKQLSQILFPVGHLKKKQVRKIATKFDLPTAGKRESQEVCFIPDGDVHAFLQRYLKMFKGEIKNIADEKVIGTHEGLAQYTIGQRKGIGLPGGPWFVVSLDTKKNILWVTNDRKNLLISECGLSQINWLSDAPKLPIKVNCKVRYSSSEVRAVVYLDKKKMKLKFNQPQLAVTPGQSAVFYRGKRCLGGAVIV